MLDVMAKAKAASSARGLMIALRLGELAELFS